jgi:hypothetical protein
MRSMGEEAFMMQQPAAASRSIDPALWEINFS